MNHQDITTHNRNSTYLFRRSRRQPIGNYEYFVESPELGIIHSFDSFDPKIHQIIAWRGKTRLYIEKGQTHAI